MAEYKYNDIIMDPNDPRLENAIGKECYLSDYPREALKHAINHTIKYRLKSINKEEICPFVDDEDEDNWACIIINKEEPKPKYVHFENAEEFLDAYYRNETNKLDGIYRYLATRGIWVKGKGTYNSYYMVTELWDDGVIIGDSKINTTQVSSDRYFTANDTTDWHELYDKYTFLDGTPCGKLSEEEQ